MIALGVPKAGTTTLSFLDCHERNLKCYIIQILALFVNLRKPQVTFRNYEPGEFLFSKDPTFELLPAAHENTILIEKSPFYSKLTRKGDISDRIVSIVKEEVQSQFCLIRQKIKNLEENSKSQISHYDERPLQPVRVAFFNVQARKLCLM